MLDSFLADFERKSVIPIPRLWTPLITLRIKRQPPRRELWAREWLSIRRWPPYHLPAAERFVADVSIPPFFASTRVPCPDSRSMAYGLLTELSCKIESFAGTTEVILVGHTRATNRSS